MMCGLLKCPVASRLDRPSNQIKSNLIVSRLFQLFFYEKVYILFRSRRSNRRPWRRPWVTFEGHFRYCKRFHCLYMKYTAYIMYKVNYNGRTWR